MILQIFGKKNCNESKKAERFFKERKIKFQFINLSEKGISKGELNAITRVIPLDDLLDKEGKEYKKKNLKYMVYDLNELLSENPELFKTPILRYKNHVSQGYKPDEWKEWDIS